MGCWSVVALRSRWRGIEGFGRMSGMSKATTVQDQEKPLQKNGRHKVLPRWKPGISANPGGRPKSGEKHGVLHYLRVVIAEVSDKKGPNGRPMTRAESLARATVKLAERGHPQALKECWERLEGRVKQEIDVTVESSLWQRLNQGRARLGVQSVVQDVIAPTFDEAADIIETVATDVTEVIDSKPDTDGPA